MLLRKDGHYKERTVTINRSYLNYDVNFKLVASVKEASKALNKGVENTMLRNSIELLRNRQKKSENITVLDVGANFGYLTLVWAKSICQNGTVISFEASPIVYKTLSKSVALNNADNIRVENLAVGNDNKAIKLFLNDSTSNVMETEDSGPSEMVNMVRIDDYVSKKALSRCDLIKIDVDGIELDILKGSIDVLNKYKPIFIVETNDDYEIISFFIENNYKILDEKLEVYNDEDRLPPNVYCIPN